DPDVRLTKRSAAVLLPWLLGIGLLVGLFSGFFGIGGGFLIVPGLMLATGMPLPMAIGTSLVAVSAFGAATAASYAASGLIDWPLAGFLSAAASWAAALERASV
ncbi:TSUP family transporter, partial [Halomonas sp. ND22Bw]|uniref:TSUP family transporter n=1 Tax=Halomonas sp. ND22Bw TaxID=2054178 RepID=UPI001C636249